MSDLPVPILGYCISEFIPELGHEMQTIINTINPHSYCVAKEDAQFQRALQSSDVLLPDGIGIVYATKWLVGKRIRKIAGSDLHFHLIQKANKEGLKIFYLGASQETLQKIQNRLASEQPNCIVGIYSPPYKAEFSQKENKEMIAIVNAFVPDILFVGMTAPKQEKWVHAHKAQIDARIICSIGAVFDFYAGSVKRSHPIWIKMGLEWFPRLLREPRRLWRRTFISSPLFFMDVFKFKMSELAKNRSLKRA
jgi:N-acetylglucosaminyldiphosphoundecaprenol N-acetyl-beta-D-mannosaminyltransferase